MTRTKPNELQAAAMAYIIPNGRRPALDIFPVAARGKTPAIEGGHGCLDATHENDTVKAWWSDYKKANIGIATGGAHGIVVIDIDRNHTPGVDGEETLKELETKLGPLPETAEVLTPNGGRHLYFSYPAGYNIRNAEGGQQKPPIPGIDIRGNGGYVVAPPSTINGKKYEWEVSAYPNEVGFAELPESWKKWLHNLKEKDTRGDQPQQNHIGEGARNSSVFRFACSLRAQSVPEESIREQTHAFNKNDCVPPLDDSEVERCIASALKYAPGTSLAAMGFSRGKSRLTRAALAEQMTAMGFGITYNLITCEYEITGRTAAGRAMSQDDLITLLHDALADNYKGATFDTLAAYITFEGREHSFNPVLDILNATKWDGVDRITQLYSLIGIDESDSLSQVLVKKWLMQTVALLFNNQDDPFGADGVLVFNGEQGAGKTSLFRHLAMRESWFGEGLSVNDRDKDTTRRIVTVWIAELGEVESTLKSDINSLKAFVSAATDHYRLPYGRADIVAPRLTSLCATCNSDRYLIDPTGNRRWWSIPFTRTIPRAELEALDALQLWAQVFTTVAALPYPQKKACFRLTEEERAALAKRNGDFEKPMKAQTEIEDILARAESEGLEYREITITDFKEYWPTLRRYDSRQIGQALIKCGVQTTQKRMNGSKGRFAELPIPPSY